MRLTKLNQKKLGIFADLLGKYLNDWGDNKNYFYYANCHQKELAEQLSQTSNKETNEIFNEMDKEDKDIVKNMLSAVEIRFSASPDKPTYQYSFTW